MTPPSDRRAAAEALAAQVREEIEQEMVDATSIKHLRGSVYAGRDLADLLALLRDALDGMERHGRIATDDDGPSCYEDSRPWPCPDYAAWERTATAAEAALARLAALYGVVTGQERVQSCRSDDPDTGLHCMKPRGHVGPHWVELEWTDDDDETAPASNRPEPTP